jgi:5-methylcytosine-specific restriction endonuclease McrA
MSAIVTWDASCVRCGSKTDLVAHHKLPRRFGGTNLISNLQPVCRSCHPSVEAEAVIRARVARLERPWFLRRWATSASARSPGSGSSDPSAYARRGQPPGSPS